MFDILVDNVDSAARGRQLCRVLVLLGREAEPCTVGFRLGFRLGVSDLGREAERCVYAARVHAPSARPPTGRHTLQLVTPYFTLPYLALPYS